MKANYKITQGVYVLTTKEAGCIVDAVSTVSNSPEKLISIAVNKQNYTNQMLAIHKKIILSILDEKLDKEVIDTFGFHTSRDYNKFDKVEMLEKEGIKYPKNSIGYMYCEVVDSIDVETHTLFIVRIKNDELIKDEKPLTYAHYREHKDKYLQEVTTEQSKTAWICTICGYVYYGNEIPDNYKCPKCGVPKEVFKKQNKRL